MHTGYVEVGLCSSGSVLYGCGKWAEWAEVVNVVVKVCGVGGVWYLEGYVK